MAVVKNAWRLLLAVWIATLASGAAHAQQSEVFTATYQGFTISGFVEDITVGPGEQLVAVYEQSGEPNAVLATPSRLVTRMFFSNISQLNFEESDVEVSCAKDGYPRSSYFVWLTNNQVGLVRDQAPLGDCVIRLVATVKTDATPSAGSVTLFQGGNQRYLYKLPDEFIDASSYDELEDRGGNLLATVPQQTSISLPPINFRITDGIDPVLTVPSDIVVATDVGDAVATVSFAATVTDNSGADITPVYTFEGGPITSPHAFPIGVHTVTVKATDPSMAYTEDSFTVTVTDEELPVLTAPADMTIIADAGLATSALDVTTLGSVTDNSGEVLGITYAVGATVLTGTYDFPIGDTVVTLDATDSAGNAAIQESFTVTVTDDELPMLTPPADVVQATDPGLPTASISFAVTVTDNADAGLDPVYTIGAEVISSPFDFPIGETIVTVDVTDSAGNAANQVSFTVTVTDDEMPLLTAGPPISVEADTGGSTALLDVTDHGIVSDNADSGIPIIYTVGSTILVGPYEFPLGVTLVTMDATDSAGNAAAQVSFTVTVTDTTAPLAPVVGSFSSTANGQITITGTAEPGTTVTVTFPDGSQASADIGPDGNYSVTSAAGQVSGEVSVFATDVAGNESTLSILYVVVDHVSPEVVLSGLPESAVQAMSLSLTISFSEDVVGFDRTDVVATNAAVVSVTGGPAIYLATLTTNGSGAVTVQVPAGAAQDLAGNASLASNTLTVADQTVEETQKLIAGFQLSRANQLLNNQPDLIDLLTGPRMGSAKMFMNETSGNFAFANRGDGPIWMIANGAWSDEDSAQSRYLFGAIGSHRAVTPSLSFGAMLQFDQSEQTDGLARIAGTGWLVGPYVVGNIPDQPLFFEARALWGQSKNEVSPFGTYTDVFDTDRALVQAKVAGQMIYGRTTLSPNVDLSYTTDRQKPYTDGLGNPVPAQRIELAQVSVGLDIRQDVETAFGPLQLTGGISGIWSHNSGTGVASTVVPAFEGGRAKINFGLRQTFTDGATLGLSGYYDGIGSSGYDSWGLAIDYVFVF